MVTKSFSSPPKPIGPTKGTLKVSHRSRIASRLSRGYGVFLLPSAAISVLLVALPLGGLMVLSVLRWNPSEQAAPSFAGLTNFIHMVSDGVFWGSLTTTLLFVVETVALQMVLGFGIALLFNRSWLGVSFLRALVLTPMMIAPIFAGMIWRLMLSPDYGIVKYLLSLVRVDSPPLWLSDSGVALQAIVIANTWQWTPFVVLFATAGLQVIPQDVYEAASLDGANRFTTLRHIVLPLLRPVLLVILLFRCIDSFKVFDVIYTMTGGGPGSSTQTLSYSVYLQTVRYFDLGYSSTLALVVLGVIMLSSWLLLRVSTQVEQ